MEVAGAYGRHALEVIGRDGQSPTTVRVTHPEHEKVEWEVGLTRYVRFLPGSSRPFQLLRLDGD